ncbi:hypothetical protein ACFL2J_07330 [Candidatus Omnitrophota bacterium]
MSKQSSIIAVCVFIGVGIFSFTKSIDLFWDKNALDRQIEGSLKPKIVQLENDNIQINRALKKVKNTLAETEKTLLAIEEENTVIHEALITERFDLRKTQKLLKDKEGELAKIASKHNEISSENKLLKDKFNAMYVEFLEMKRTLTSIEGLRKVLRELRSSSKKNRKTTRLVRKNGVGSKIVRKKRNASKKKDQNSQIQGNSGYLIKNGQSTYVPKVRIKVLTVDE